MSNLLYDAIFAPLATRKTPFLLLQDERQISGTDFHANVAQIANALRSAGAKPGDRIAAQVHKSPQALAVYAASLAIGAVFLPLNTAYTADELDYFLGNATPAVFLCDPSRAASLGPVAARHAAVLFTLDAAGQGSLTDLAASHSSSLRVTPRSPDDLAAILYTSGTTGRSKGAMLSHDNLLSNARTLATLWRFGPDDTLLHALPIFHTHGLFVACNTALLTQGRMIFLPEFDVATVLRLLPQASVMMGVPTFYTRLLDAPNLSAAAQNMRLFISGSAPLLADTHLAFEAATGHRILERYGMTETNMNTSNPYDGPRRAGTVGLPLPDVDLRIMADDRIAAQGEVGMIQVRGPNVFQGYWQMPDKTAQDLTPDGWFLTGDLATQDADGYITIVGRAKDLVISGGYNIYPKEIELLLDEAASVLESAVIGLPHPDLGEAVFAVLTPRKGAILDAAVVLATLQDRIARFKQPRGAVVLDTLPRNTMGKVQKNLLRAQFKDWFAPKT